MDANVVLKLKNVSHNYMQHCKWLLVNNRQDENKPLKLKLKVFIDYQLSISVQNQGVPVYMNYKPYIYPYMVKHTPF